MDRTHQDWLQLSDEELLSHCDKKEVKGSGKGGQKRNKTSNGIQLRLQSWQVQETHSRSRLENQKKALKKLKLVIAGDLWVDKMPRKGYQDPIPPLKGYIQAGVLRINEKNNQFPWLLACLLDALLKLGVKGVAEALDTSSSQIARFFERNPAHMASFRQIQEYGRSISHAHGAAPKSR